MNSVNPISTWMRIKYEGKPTGPDEEFDVESVKFGFTAPTIGTLEKYYPVMPNFPIVLYSNNVILFHYFYTTQMPSHYFEITFDCCDRRLAIGEPKMFCNVDTKDSAVNVDYFPIVTDPCMRIENDSYPVTKDELVRKIKIEMQKLTTDATCGRRKRTYFDLASEPEAPPLKIKSSDTREDDIKPSISSMDMDQPSTSSRALNISATQDNF